MFITSCSPDTSPASILANLENFSKKFSGPVNEDGLEIEIKHEFLGQKDEVDGEAKAVFDLNKAKTDAILTTIATKTAIANFGDSKKVALVAIGSSSTQAYYFDSDDGDKMKGLAYPVGTSSSDDQKDKLKAMLEDVLKVSKKTEVVFFNSISFAKPKTNLSQLLNATTPKFAIEKADKDEPTKMVPDTAGITANLLLDILADKTGVNAVIYGNDPDKLSNKWTEFVMKEVKLDKEAQAIVCDWGGGSFSCYLVNEVGGSNKVAEKKLPPAAVPGKKETEEDNWKQKDVVEHYKMGGSDVPPQLMDIRGIMIKWAKEWAADPAKNKKGLKKINMYVYQTGQLRQLYFEVKDGTTPELVTAFALPRFAVPSWFDLLKPEHAQVVRKSC